jgi:arginyl-tRNA synthetase
MKQQIQEFFAGIVETLGINPATVIIETSENPIHGDYTTNIAMISAGHLKAPPMVIAQKIVDTITQHQKKSPVPWLEKVETAPPGFINITVSEATFGTTLAEVLREKDRYGATSYTDVTYVTGLHGGQKPPVKQHKKTGDVPSGQRTEKTLQKTATKGSAGSTGAGKGLKNGNPALFGNRKNIMVEFAHPNTHKAFHIGHLRNITTGECVVRLLESQGHKVIRANYQGDVGMHIAKALYALINVSPFKDKVTNVTGIKNRVEFLGKAYAAGSKAFEESENAKKIIGEINKKIYERDPSVMPVYRETRQWSLDYFNSIYKRVYTHYDRLYFESEVYEKGKEYVLEALKKGIFEKSEGAVIFPGEKFGLHNRVFITSDGNTTYEGKDIGLGRLQFDEYHPDLIVHCVGPEQAGYFQVIFKALEQVFPDTTGKEFHLIYGWVKLKHGKMSSRLGNVVLGEWLIDEVKKAIKTILEQSISKDKEVDQDAISETIAIGAIKYSFLKVSTPSEIAFDLEESINTNGDSGPYIQYAYARCKSVLRKAGDSRLRGNDIMNPEERAIARLIIQFPDVVSDAATRFAPNVICTYLFQLAQAFNLFYAKHEILGHDTRLMITAATAQVLKNGLYLLGIETLERM